MCCLRIRRLGIRIPPSAPPQAQAEPTLTWGFCMSGGHGRRAAEVLAALPYPHSYPDVTRCLAPRAGSRAGRQHRPGGSPRCRRRSSSCPRVLVPENVLDLVQRQRRDCLLCAMPERAMPRSSSQRRAGMHARVDYPRTGAGLVGSALRRLQDVALDRAQAQPHEVGIGAIEEGLREQEAPERPQGSREAIPA
jgi:hypothetical protein